MNTVNGKTGPWTGTNRPGWYGLNARKKFEAACRRSIQIDGIVSMDQYMASDDPDGTGYDELDQVEDRYTAMRITSDDNFNDHGQIKVDALDDYFANAEYEIVSANYTSEERLPEKDDLVQWYQNAALELNLPIQDEDIHIDTIKKVLDQDGEPGIGIADITAFLLMQDSYRNALEKVIGPELSEKPRKKTADRFLEQYNITIPINDDFNGIISPINRALMFLRINVPHPVDAAEDLGSDMDKARINYAGTELIGAALKTLQEELNLSERARKYTERIKAFYEQKENKRAVPRAFEAQDDL